MTITNKVGSILQILYGLDYVTQDNHMSTDQVSRARFEYDQHERRIALVEFRHREDAEYFMDKYKPTISFPLEHSMGRDSKVLTFDIHFARRDDGDHPRNQRSTENNWYCPHVGPPISSARPHITEC